MSCGVNAALDYPIRQQRENALLEAGHNAFFVLLQIINGLYCWLAVFFGFSPLCVLPLDELTFDW